MKEWLEALSTNEVIIIYGLIGVVAFLILIVILVDFSARKKFLKNQAMKKAIAVKEVKEETIEVADVSKENDEIELLEIEEVPVEVVNEPVKEEIVYADPVLDQTTAQLELQKLTEELQNRKDPDPTEALLSFEEEQEENAIISLEELLKRGQSLYQKNEQTQYQENDAPINIMELQARYEQKEVFDDEQEELPTVTSTVIQDLKEVSLSQEEAKKFISTPFISPIYGLEKSEPLVAISNENVDMQFENTANYDKLDEEIRKTNQFLNVLKELQKNLD